MAVRCAWLLSLAGCASLLPKQNPFPDHFIVSPGIKVGYTIGARHGDGGLTWGAELTFPRRTWADLHAIVAAGPAINLTWSPHAFQFRAGGELVSWFAGIEGGPAVVSDRSGVHYAFAIGPWAGLIVVPYFTHTFVFIDGQDYNDFGTYLKLPICPSCPAGRDHFHFDD